jgi:hypothetical protein
MVFRVLQESASKNFSTVLKIMRFRDLRHDLPWLDVVACETKYSFLAVLLMLFTSFY